MYEFQFHDVKTNIVKKCTGVMWIQTLFLVYIKTDDIYNDIVESAGPRFDTSNCELYRPLPKGKNRKDIIFLLKKLIRLL